jgi:hypothetical protein
MRRVNVGDPVAEKGPLAMIPVAQLYARDVPDLPCPDGTDLLQVLWCTFNSSRAGQTGLAAVLAVASCQCEHPAGRRFLRPLKAFVMRQRATALRSRRRRP